MSTQSETSLDPVDVYHYCTGTPLFYAVVLTVSYPGPPPLCSQSRKCVKREVVLVSGLTATLSMDTAFVTEFPTTTAETLSCKVHKLLCLRVPRHVNI